MVLDMTICQIFQYDTIFHLFCKDIHLFCQGYLVFGFLVIFSIFQYKFPVCRVEFATPIGVNLRIYLPVGVNQRQMRLAECASGILHDLAGFQPRYYQVSHCLNQDSQDYQISRIEDFGPADSLQRRSVYDCALWLNPKEIP